jgi:hypothetical protein
MWTYDAWIGEQADKVRSALNRLAYSGIHDAAIYVMPSHGATQGELIVSTSPVDGAVDVVRFPGHGDRVSGIAYSHMHSALWHACRHLPICPVS